jgi:anti-anti-sigma factor
MQATVTVADGCATVSLVGRFDFNAHREFREAVDSSVAQSTQSVTVDFGAVDYLDSSALGMLLMLRDKAKAAGREVTLMNCKGPVKQVLDIANFGKLFRIE